MYSCSSMQFGKERNGIFSLPKTTDSFEARIRGVQNVMSSFNFYYGCTSGRATSDADRQPRQSRALQDSPTSAAQGNRLAQDVVKTLLTDRTDTSFSLFGFGSYRAKLQRFWPLRILSYPGKEKHQSGTKLENRTPTTFLKLS